MIAENWRLKAYGPAPIRDFGTKTAGYYKFMDIDNKTHVYENEDVSVVGPGKCGSVSYHIEKKRKVFSIGKIENPYYKNKVTILTEHNLDHQNIRSISYTKGTVYENDAMVGFRKKDPVTEHLNIFQTSIEYIILNNIDRVVQKIFISDGSVIYAEEILRLSNYFNKVDIIRPEGRNIGTTEAYLICTGFRAFQITRDKNWLIVMHKNMCKEIMSELNSRKFVERKFKEIVTVTSGTKEIRQVERMGEVKRYWNEEIKLLKALGTKTWIETGTPPLKRKKMRE